MIFGVLNKNYWHKNQTEETMKDTFARYSSKKRNKS